MATRVDGADEARRRRLAMTAHHMTGKTSLGKVPGQDDENEHEPTAGYEYDPFEAGDFTKAWISNVLAGELVPVFLEMSKRRLPDGQFPIFTGTYGPTVRSRSAIFMANTAAELVAGPLSNLVRAAVHNVAPSLAGSAKPGLGLELPPPNILAASFVKTVATGVAKTWLTTSFAPPAPAPASSATPSPGSSPVGSKAAKSAPETATPAAKALPGQSPQSATVPRPVEDAATGPTFLGKDLKALAHETAMWAVGYGISKIYDQTVGPLVQKSLNQLMGKGDEEVKKPAPMTPGGLASAAASSFLSGLLLRPTSWPVGSPTGGVEGAAAGAAAPKWGLLSAAVVNGLIATAFDTVYSAGVGPAIENTVNSMAGYEVPERTPPTYTLERLMRTMARSGLSATTYYLADGATQPIFQQLGATVGGAMGALLTMAGPALSGMVAAGAADALLGAHVGSLAGSVFEWITGQPKAEHRPQAMPAPAAPDAADPQPASGTPNQQATAGLAPRRRRAAVAPTAAGGGYTPQRLAALAAANVVS